MKRVLFSITGTVLGLVALLDFKSHSHGLTAAGGLPSAALPGASSAAPATTPSTPAVTSSSPAPAGTTAASARTVAGQAITTQYGIVQVQITVVGHKITNASFLQLSAFDGRSQQINSYAGPILLQETLSAQSAQVDSVSGASYTSAGYQQSLQSALDKAGL